LPLEKRDFLGLSHLDVIQLKKWKGYSKLTACLTLILRIRNALGSREKKIMETGLGN
jgi:hypothetical protein